MQTITEVSEINQTFYGAEMTDFSDEEPPKILWNTDEYHRLSDLGFFNGKRVELIEGEIFVKYTSTEFEEVKYKIGATGGLHFSGVNVTAGVLREVFGEKYFVSVQGSIDLGENSELEPDISVIAGKARDFKEAIPKTAALIVEISDVSLFYDRSRKVSLYAKADIQDYWIVNLQDRRLEVFRRPMKNDETFYGFSYGEMRILKENDEVSPLAAPEAKIKIADLLP